MTQAIVTGQHWREVGEDGEPSTFATWCVVSISVEGDGVIGLSGPGPCRGYQTIEDTVLLRDWELVIQAKPR
jgi:hypothetical protein